MSNITIRPMEPEDWNAVSEIYSEGIATEHATFQTTCPPYTAWDAFHIKDDNSIKTQGEEKELTLFTCSQKGTMRFVVRCIYKEAVMDE